MHGPDILVRSLSRAAIEDEFGNRWQYHSRSDRHSKIACWGLLFDLLTTSQLLREQAASGAIAFGINHRMVDFKQDRRKVLDLVLCTPASLGDGEFAQLVDKYTIELTSKQKETLAALPPLRQGSVGSVRLALEAKACMTAHTRALPRLYDELNSSHRTIHGAADVAIAAGLVMVNVAETFVSPDKNKRKLGSGARTVSTHKQPRDAERTIQKAKQIPRRSKPGEEGFDSLAIIVVDSANDGSAARLVTAPPAPPDGDIFRYEMAVHRLADLYAARFRER